MSRYARHQPLLALGAPNRYKKERVCGPRATTCPSRDRAVLAHSAAPVDKPTAPTVGLGQVRQLLYDKPTAPSVIVGQTGFISLFSFALRCKKHRTLKYLHDRTFF